MSGIEYHMEALRKQRVLDRKRQAQQSFGSQSNSAMELRAFQQERDNFQQRMNDHYTSRRNLGSYHDSGFAYRQSGGTNIHPDKIYPVMYPSGPSVPWHEFRRSLSVHIDPIHTIMYPTHEDRHQHTALNMGIPHYLLE